ncbi:MAG: hypothetical protein WBE68_08835 [Candidatus Nitrosopolaris sp.]
MSTTCATCGRKSEDYVIECSCCGNCYCSYKCEATDHRKKPIHHRWTDFKRIYENIMKSDQNIRVVTISDLKGSGHREGIRNLLSSKESKKSLEMALKGWKIRGELAPGIGRGKYVLAEYGKIKRITMPLGEDHLLYVTTEGACDHSTLIERIKLDFVTDDVFDTVR